MESTPTPLRLWPGVTSAVLIVFSWLALPSLFPDSSAYGMLGAAGFSLLTLLWWLFFSRAPWRERLVTLGAMAAALFLTRFLVHKSIAGVGMGFLLYILAIPQLMVALVAALVLTRQASVKTRRIAIAAAILLVCGGLQLVRTGGISGAGGSEYAWRWTPTPEERLLALGEKGGKTVDGAALAAGNGDWPGFRGPLRDGIAIGAAAIETGWSTVPPSLLWKHPVGPGWSSFAVRGGLFYTQEQRGEEEVVSCYDLKTGEAVWKHRDAARFWEANGGAGPRGTPTLSGDRVYTLGGTGIINALDAATGKKIWSHDGAQETGAKTPTWGFSGSPLVVGDLVLVAVSGRLVAYDAETGEQRWLGPEGKTSYSSPHLLTLGGVEQVVLLSGAETFGISPQDGKVLWRHEWPGYPIVQPAVTPDGDLLISVNQGSGLRRLDIEQQDGVFTVKEVWTTNGLKPYFNDFVVHRGHAYGFDGQSIAVVDLVDGKRKWKGGRYGEGQLILLPEQDLLLILSETGELALVEAKSEAYSELTRIPAIEGKTWNHPVVLGDLLLVRNDREMAAYRLPPRKA